jgi:hypothetical protein
VVTIEKNTSLELVLKKGEACSFTTRLHGEGDMKTIEYKRKTITIFTHSFRSGHQPEEPQVSELNANVMFVDKKLAGGDLASASLGSAIIQLGQRNHLGRSRRSHPRIRGRPSR